MGLLSVVPEEKMCATLRLIAVSVPVSMTDHYVALFLSVLLDPLAGSSTCRPCRSLEFLAVPVAGEQLPVHSFPSLCGHGFAVALGSGSLPIFLPVVLPSEDHDSLIRRPVECSAVVVGPHFHAEVVKICHLLYHRRDRLGLIF